MKTCLFLLCSYLLISPAKAQYITFSDSILVRENPATSSKVIGQLRHNTPIQVVYDDKFPVKPDSLDGVKSFWIYIKQNDFSGYVWEPTLTCWNILSKTRLNHTFLVQLSSKKKLAFKVFKNGTFMHYSSFDIKETGDIAGCISLGKTYNSRGKEIIGIRYENNPYDFDLFEWDGKKIKTSVIPLTDTSPITGKYIKYTMGYINSNQVRMRETPNSDGKILHRFDKNTAVEIKTFCDQTIQINEEFGCWQAVRTDSLEGYIWSTYIDIPLRYIKSNTKEKESFLFTNHALYAFREDQISGYLKFKNSNFGYLDSTTYTDSYNYKFTNYGNRGLDKKYSILGIHFLRESGQQEDFYCWDGVKFNYLGTECCGEDYICSTFTFPETTGIKDRILETRHEENNFINYDNIRYYKQNYLMQFNGDSLVEVPSKYSLLRQELKNKFPNHRMQDSWYGNIDKDGIEDVIFTLQEKSGAQVIGFAFGTKEETFTKFKFNTLIGSKGGIFEMACPSPNILEFKLEYSETDYSIYRYGYDKTIDQYIWQTVTNMRTRNDEVGSHAEIKIKRFKTKAILFENSWQSNWYQKSSETDGE